MGRKSKSEWQSLLAEFEASRISQQQFCDDHGIRLSGFRKQLYDWRHRKASNQENQPPEGSGFVMVAPAAYPTITKAGAFGTAVALTIGPFTLTVERNSDPAALRLALQAVAETCGRT
jgi:hypothetical protein